MVNGFASPPQAGGVLWVNLAGSARSALAEGLAGAFNLHQVCEPGQVASAIQRHAPAVLCFEFDEPDAPGLAALARARQAHPLLLVLMIASRHAEALALWALHLHVWDLLVKPVSSAELSQCIAALVDLERGGGRAPVAAQVAHSTAAPPDPDAQARTWPAIAHVAAHYSQTITLGQVAALCHLSPCQFCRVFKQEQGLNFGQYLLRHRTSRACELLAQPGALAKDVAYAVGFYDFSYFARAFKRQVGVCPSEYRAGAR